MADPVDEPGVLYLSQTSLWPNLLPDEQTNAAALHTSCKTAGKVSFSIIVGFDR